MSVPHYMEDCLSRKILFFTGKGGVGKSTLAWATAMACRQQGKRVLVAGWSPFDSLTPPVAAEKEGIDWLPLETFAAFREYALHALKFERIYDAVFDNHVLKTFIRAAPGLSETVIAGKIWDLYDKGIYDLIVVDLPSSGHAISFFQSPLGVEKIFSIGFVHREAVKICEMFQAATTRVDIVALPEELPISEASQLKEKLGHLLPLHFGFLHMNQCTPEFPISNADVLHLPHDLQQCVGRYLKRRQFEEEALTLSDIGLPMLKIPRFASEDLTKTVEQTFHFLELR